MGTPKSLWCLSAVLACGFSWVGCATVDPAPDFQRASQEITRATGYAGTFQPDDAEVVAARVNELLGDGLSAGEAAQICLLNNPTLQAAFLDIGIARADVVQSGLFSNPSLGVAWRLPSGGGLANFEADLAQNIVGLWQIPIRKRVAQQSLDRTILEVAAQAAKLAAGAKVAYHVAVGADRHLEIARENLELTRKVLEFAVLRRDVGAHSELDVNLARGVVLEAELAVREARLAAATARRSLVTMLGLTIQADQLVLAEAAAAPPAHELAVDALVETALAGRLDLRATRAAVTAAYDRLVLEYRRVFPSLEIGLALERGERGRSRGRDLLADTARSSISAGRLTAPEIEPRSARRKNTAFIIGPSLSLELPIFDQNQAQIARARYELEQSTRFLEGLERTVRQEVRGAVDQAQTAWRVARFYQDQVVPQAQKSLDLSRDSYQAGKASILSVLEAERMYLSARDRYAEALQTAAATIPHLERTVGRPFEELVEVAGKQLLTDATASQPSNGRAP